MSIKKILIAVDDSPYSIKAASTGFALADSLQAMIAVLYVVDKSREIINGDLGITPEQSRLALLKEAENVLEQYIKMYNNIGKIIRFTPEGLPETEILNIAREWEADLIVMGTHGRSGLDHILAGSVAEQVIRHAEIPVLVIPPGMK
jgi:nucleotide-binding universal stress UspA family protein